MSPTCNDQARVTEVYPTANVLPENLLRFYIYFSKPMQSEGALSSIRLVDDTGERVHGAFLETKVELWSPDRRRLTLLFDPGRVKTGLVAHRTWGRALLPQKNYELIIESNILDLDGCQLQMPHHKKFQATAADLDAPNVQKWQLKPPKSQTKSPLSVMLNGIHDHVSLAYRLRVKDDQDDVVLGRIELTNMEEEWVFVPDAPWKSQDYRLIIDPILEDIAGNRITGTFEQPLTNRARKSQATWLALSFRPSHPSQ